MNVYEAYREIKDEIISIRRQIHRNPELSFEEFETADTVCRFLDKYGIEYERNIAITGVCAFIGNKSAGKSLLVRADMDALPYDEQTDLPFSSAKKGVMHACGHDIHVANALAVCYILKKHEALLDGLVKVVFQPGEETTGGAKPMIKAGVLEKPRPDMCVGIHITPSYPTGELYFKSGALMASPDDFLIEFIGKSAHGAEPHNGINPIAPASEFVVGIKEKLAEKIDFSHNVFTVCCINSGTVNNIIPDTARIEGTFRSFGLDDRRNAESIMKEYADELCQKYGTKCNVIYNYLYPPLINDADVCKKVKDFAEKEFGKASVKEFEKPLMTGEDFSYFALEVPSVFIWAGCAVEGKKCSLHSSRFEADENVIDYGTRLLAGFALEYLAKK